VTIAQGNLNTLFYASLLEHAKQGRALEAICDGWEMLDFRSGDQVTEKETSVWNDVAEQTSRHPHLTSQANPGSFSAAVVCPRGKIVSIDPNFTLWLGDPGAFMVQRDTQDIVRLTRSGRACRKLIPDRSGRPILVTGLEAYLGMSWPLSEASKAALVAHPQAICLIAFAPTRSDTILERVRATFDLSRSEAKLAIALLHHDSLEEAALSTGITEMTANGYRKSLFKKMGVRRRGEMVQIILELGHRERCNDTARKSSALREMFSLTDDQMSVLAELASGDTIPQAAKSLGMNIHTARDHVRTMFDLVGVNKQSELVRVALEYSALVTLTEASEVRSNAQSDLWKSTRVMARPTQGLIYLADYGPKDGVPVILFHAGLGTRRIAPSFQRLMANAGLRLIIIERPGFGGTDLRQEQGFEGSSLDTDFVMEKLGIERAIIASNGGGNIAALSFAERFPERVMAGLLINPTPTRGHEIPGRSPGSGLRRLTFANPSLIRAMAKAFRNQARSNLLDGPMDKYFSTCEADKRAMAIPEVRAIQRASTQAAMARTIEGFVREEEVFVKSWSIPNLRCGQWSVLVGLEDHTCDAQIARRLWARLPGFSFVPVANAGRMIFVSRGEIIVEALQALANQKPMPIDPQLRDHALKVA
jgi:DNA-binding CsgD family transcriptional regulator/pimeloyl-ACP methyl ester carboxylesterase